MQKLTVKKILAIASLTVVTTVVVSMIAKTLIGVLFFGEFLSIHYFFYLAVWISIPCLLVALIVKEYRKKVVIPPMIACGLSAIWYFYAFKGLREMIFFLEILICIVIFAICYILYAYPSKARGATYKFSFCP